ncbi:MAG: DUF4760 domain-containing protein [Candidatus Eremiobacteraeota bacterium]|nr:DUF4760 domain-containing protein [Candidatus Eremiobacteraeota bacterium]MBV8365753.1 DUF4760 domain-containing protein [Candidatus Eremiobacteraeota bacterium]
MSLELLSTLATVGTFVVIGATAVVAVIQLRHVRASNQIAAILQIGMMIEEETAQSARRFIRDELDSRLHDAEFRSTLAAMPIGTAARPVVLLGNHYERLGLFVKRGIIDEDLACDLWSAQVSGDWDRMAPALAIIRRTQGNSVFENFEYMVEVSDEWLARHPHGAYPANRKRRPLPDTWLNES